MTSHRRPDCRMCRSRRIEEVLRLEATPVADAFVPDSQRLDPQEYYPLDLFLCRDCGHVQLLDVVDPEVLYGRYKYSTRGSLGLDEHYRCYAEDALGFIQPAADALVVEFGSNDGTLLRHFQRAGMRVLGIDPAADIARRASEEGIETIVDWFTTALGERLRAARGGGAVLCANNVVANIDDLADMAGGVRRLLTANGVFVFETGYLLDLVRHGVFDNIYHEHLGYFSVKPAEAFFRRHGMELIRVDRVETKGGSIRGFVQLAGGPRARAPSVDEWIAEEERHRLYDAATYAELGRRIGEAGSRLREMLEAARRRGARIAGYGASHSVTTLVHEFRIAEFLEFLVDDNAVKHHTFSPGHHIPVLAPDALYERRPDYVLILPWRFEEPIRRKHARFAERGGRFVRVWPEPSVVDEP